MLLVWIVYSDNWWGHQFDGTAMKFWMPSRNWEHSAQLLLKAYNEKLESTGSWFIIDACFPFGFFNRVIHENSVIYPVDALIFRRCIEYCVPVKPFHSIAILHTDQPDWFLWRRMCSNLIFFFSYILYINAF